MIRVPYVKDKAQVEKVIEEAKENNGIICYTVVSPELREHIAHKAMEHDVEVDGANQAFHIQYVGDDQYKIGYGNEELCIAVASDKETVVIQGYDSENEYNKWNISRIGTTQNYLFTNVATGNTLCYEYSSDFSAYRLYVKTYDETSGNFAFFIGQ